MRMREQCSRGPHKHADGAQVLLPRAEGDHPLLHGAAAEGVRNTWPNVAAALERLAQNSEW
jgi:hypothetical protein